MFKIICHYFNLYGATWQHGVGRFDTAMWQRRASTDGNWQSLMIPLLIFAVTLVFLSIKSNELDI